MTAADDSVRLVATQLQPNVVGFALDSRTQGSAPSPAGNAGVLCLCGAIGRYVGPGRIQSTGAAGTFELLLALP